MYSGRKIAIFCSQNALFRDSIDAAMTALATYIHDLNPIIIGSPDSILALRWYGLAYVMGFILGFLLLRYLSRRELYTMPEAKLMDFVTSVAIYGVLVGGRFGEFFFYWLPQHGWEGFSSDPLWVFRVWEGGMASHGGIIGVVLVCLFYARRYKVSFLSLTDGLAIVAPLGIFFGRVANFINGELYGRVASADNPIAMKFPLEIGELSPEKYAQMYHAIASIAPTPIDPNNVGGSIIELSRSSEPVRNLLGHFLTPRYPSQLFEALAEGLIIFLILFILRIVWKKAPTGIFCAFFALLYAAGRIICEYYREPDNALWMGFTRGQYLSFGLVVVGLGILFYSLKKKSSSSLN